MRKLRGGMEFPPGRLTMISPPQETMPTQPLRLRVADRPEVQVGQRLRAGEALTSPDAARRGWRVSPFDADVTLMQPADGDDDRRMYDIQIDPIHETTPTSIAVDVPQGRELSNWLHAMRKIDPWMDPDGAIGLLPQLEAALDRPPNTVILNALDRFPPYPDASSMVASFPDDAVAGVRLLADLLGVRQPIIALAKATPAPGRLRHDCRRNKTRIETVINSYPMADATLLTRLVASGKRRLRPHTNPVAQGVLLVRPWSAIRLGRWLARKRFDTVRPMLLAWPEPGVRLSVRYAWPGQPLLSIHDRLASAGRTTPKRILVGHPMTGRSAIIDAPGDDPEELLVPDHESLITLLGVDTGAPRAPEPCINCGWCAQVCPTRLRPADLWRLCRQGGPADVLINDLSWCIDCGLCTHVCPSALPLAQSFRQMSERFGRIGGLTDGA